MSTTFNKEQFESIHQQAKLFEQEFKKRRMLLAAFFCAGAIVGGFIWHAAFISNTGEGKEKLITVDEITRNPASLLDQTAKSFQDKEAGGSYIVKIEVKSL